MNRKITRVAILAICIITSIFLISNEAHSYELNFQLNPAFLIIIFSTHFIFLLIHTKRFQITIQTISNIKINFWPWVCKISSTRLLNNLIPQSGNTVRAIELKQENALAYKDYSISVGLLAWLDCIINLTIAIIIISIFTTKYMTIITLLLLLLTVLIAPKAITLLSQSFDPKNENLIPRFFLYINDKISSLSNTKNELYAISLLGAISFALMSIRLYCGFYITGQEISIPDLLVIHAALKTVLLFSIIPGNIVVQGFFAGLTTKLVGVGFTEGVIASIFLQICGYILLGFISFISFCYEISRK